MLVNKINELNDDRANLENDFNMIQCDLNQKVGFSLNFF